MVARRIGSLLVAVLLVLVTAPAVLAEDDAPLAIFGTVTDTLTGEPVVDAEVGLFTIVDYDPSHPLEDWPEDEPMHPQPVTFAFTGDDGSFAFTTNDIDPGFPTHFGVSAEGYESWWGLTGFTSAPYQLDLDLYPTSGEPAIAGTLVDQRTGELITGRYFDRWAGEYWEIATLFLSYEGEDEPFLTTSTEDGHFEAYRVDADRQVHVAAWAYGYRWYYSDTFSWDGAATTSVTFELIPLRWDVPETSAHSEGIVWIVDAEISTGYDDGSYREHLAVTRAQMATFLMRALDLEAGEADFTDVDADHAHVEGIGAVAAAGITTGYEDGSFRPSEPVTRGQMATFLWRAIAED